MYAEEFTKSKEKMVVTMGGWDGTGYDGEGKARQVYTSNWNPGKKFVKGRGSHGVWCFCLVREDQPHEVSGLPTAEYFTECDPKNR